MLIALTEGLLFELKILRKNNRYAYLRVKPNRVIEVSAPMKMPHCAILDMIHQKKQWILELSDSLGETYGQEEAQLLPPGKEEILCLKKEAEEEGLNALERVYPLVKPYGFSLPEIHVRYMTSKWGSCIEAKKKIWLNVYLVKLPEVCMDYVLLRLLLQLQYPQREPAFYNTMLNRLMPKWKTWEEMLARVKLPPKKMIASSPKLY